MRRWMFLLALPALVTAAPTTREMTVKSADGFTLKGTLTLPEGKGRKPVVILAHQYRNERKGWDALAAELHARGVGTLALDLRGHGASTDKAGTAVKVGEGFEADAAKVGFANIPGDLEAVVAWLKKQPGVNTHRLGLAGASVGGFSVIVASAKLRPGAVLALSPAGNVAWGKEASDKLVAAVKKAATATFVISSEGDGEAAENLKALKGLPGVHAQLLTGSEHGMDYLAARKDVMAVFFAEYLHKRSMAAPAPAAAKDKSATAEPTAPKPAAEKRAPKTEPNPAK